MSSYGVREVTGAGEWIMNTVSRNPEGLLLLGAGVALLMRSGRGQSAKYRYSESMSEGGRHYPGTREDSETGEGLGKRVGEAARRAGEYVSETTDKVSETARSYASSAAEYADDATQAAMERSRRMAEQARETADYVVREQPWAVALAGILAGAAVAAAFPSSRIERRTLGQAGQRLRSAAEDMGEQLMEAGMQAGERLSEVAEERGLTSEGLKEAARDVGEAFSSSLRGKEGRSAQGSNRRKPGEGAGSRPQNRPTQEGGTPQTTQAGSRQPGGAQSGKGSNTIGNSPPGGAPSGGRR
jgi:ElaB/YqjD/DUF883 family membrane-anchored ribosome-binding protein